MNALDPVIPSARYQNKKVFAAEIVYELFTPADGLPFSIAIADIRQSQAHYHKVTVETYTVVQGTIELSRDAERLTLKEGDVAVITPGQVHSARTLEQTPARITVTTVPRFSPSDYFLAEPETSAPSS